MPGEEHQSHSIKERNVRHSDNRLRLSVSLETADFSVSLSLQSIQQATPRKVKPQFVEGYPVMSSTSCLYQVLDINTDPLNEFAKMIVGVHLLLHYLVAF